MPEYLAPGVYVEEVPSGNKPIEGVSTSTAGMVGVTARGPVDDPTLVTSFADFTRKFGGYLDHRIFTNGRDLLPYAAEAMIAHPVEPVVNDPRHDEPSCIAPSSLM